VLHHDDVRAINDQVYVPRSRTLSIGDGRNGERSLTSSVDRHGLNRSEQPRRESNNGRSIIGYSMMSLRYIFGNAAWIAGDSPILLLFDVYAPTITCLPNVVVFFFSITPKLLFKNVYTFNCHLSRLHSIVHTHTHTHTRIHTRARARNYTR